MTAVSTHPTLRLVNADAAPGGAALPRRDIPTGSRTQAARRRIAADDARWALAVRTATLVEGGRAGLLTPENRRRVLESAKLMGLRPFDANLVIAIVQDAARAGIDTLGDDVQDRLRLVAPAGTGRRERENIVTACAIACTFAFVLAYAVCKWIAAG